MERVRMVIPADFRLVIVADGVILTDDRPFAKFMEETLAWYTFDMKTCLLNIVVEAEHESTEAIDSLH